MPVLEMTDMNMRGAAIAKVDGAAIFLPFAADGDVIDAEILPGGKNYLTGRTNRIISPSPFRCEADCSVYGRCGGCSLRHITYEHELEIKVRSVEQAFRRQGMSVKVSSIKSASPVGYRNKVIFHNAGGRLVYFSSGSRDPVYPDGGGCALLPREFEEIRVFCEEYFERISPSPSLGLRIGDGGVVAVTVIFDGGETASLEEFARCLTERFSFVVSIHACYGDINDPRSKFEKVYGESALPITVGGVMFRLSPASFFQVNTVGAELLCREVCELFDPRADGRYADLYCGAGMFALTLARRAAGAQIVGIEINPAAISSAKANARENGLDGVRFLAGDAAAFPRELEGLSGVVVDPPRAGLSAKARGLLLKHAPGRIVYVSCNPETLARDVEAMRDEYAVEDVRCVDMFPRTGHVETVALLSRQKADDRIRISIHTKD